MMKQPTIGLALSGGGSRAMAFHLGCLRALHDRGVLDKVSVLSGVSGGSVIAALYAYHDETFEEFERRVERVLARGMVWGIAEKSSCPLKRSESWPQSWSQGLPRFSVGLFRRRRYPWAG